MSRQSDIFEDFQVRAGTDFAGVPWADLVPNAAMVQFLEWLSGSAG